MKIKATYNEKKQQLEFYDKRIKPNQEIEILKIQNEKTKKKTKP